MAKHNANVDIRGDLRVRGRVEDNLRVHNEVEASAFYVRGVGEVFGTTNVTVAQSDDAQSFSGISTIKFEAANFYIKQNPGSTDEVQVNFRGTASGGSGGGVTTLDSLTDVTATSPSTGDLIQWDGAAWVNVPVTSTGGITQGTPVALSTGNSTISGLPSNVKRVTILLNQVSLTTRLHIRLGDSGGIESAGYDYCISTLSGTISTTGAAAGTEWQVASSAGLVHGVFVLDRIGTTHQWMISGQAYLVATGTMVTFVGSKTLSAALDRIRIDSFSGNLGGSWSVNYEI